MKIKYIIIGVFVWIGFGAKAQYNTGSGVEVPPQLEALEYLTNVSDYKAQWDTLFTFPLYEHYNVTGIETNGAHFFSTTWDSNWFFKHYMNGVIFAAFQIDSVEKIRDMAYNPDNQLFYGSDASMKLYEMDLENRLLKRTIPVHCEGVTAVRHIAYDPNLDNKNGGFWVGNWNDLGAIDLNGNQLIGADQINGELVNAYGSAYDRDSDPENPKLWFNTTLYSNSQPVPTLVPFDINTRTFEDDVFEVNGQGFPGWEQDSVVAGGACSLPINGSLYLILDFQVSGYYHPNRIAILEMAKIGINETEKNEAVPIAVPNPVADMCRIQLNGFKAEKFYLYDALGNLLTQRDIKFLDAPYFDIDISRIAGGIYTAELIGEHGKRRIKIIRK